MEVFGCRRDGEHFGWLYRRYDGLCIAGWSSLVARRAHNPKVASSNLAPATNGMQVRAGPQGSALLLQVRRSGNLQESGQNGIVIPDSWPTPPEGWPVRLCSIPYLASAVPGTGTPLSWLEGSNCQRFAYGVLALFGRSCPSLRSPELWEDTVGTFVVDLPQPLDLVFINKDRNPFGAHIGLLMAEDEVLHLCREVGRPTVWALDEFLRRPNYRVLIGSKRVFKDA